jgi:hypothetical protein
MSALMIFVAVVGLPWVVLMAAFKLVDTLQRRRVDLIARQIAVTDAIHREFGAVVAPTLRRARGGWRVTLPMDPRHPDAARIMELAASTLGSSVVVGVRSRRPFDGRGEPVVGVRSRRPFDGRGEPVVGVRSRRPFEGRGEPVIEVAIVAPWQSAPRRIAPQNKERIASAMSA